jgi:hypothetical protein
VSGGWGVLTGVFKVHPPREFAIPKRVAAIETQRRTKLLFSVDTTFFVDFEVAGFFRNCDTLGESFNDSALVSAMTIVPEFAPTVAHLKAPCALELCAIEV